MKKLNDLLQEAGVSKVKLAKYLGVSRQMVYNYLELNNIESWPSEKRILICKLLGINEEKPDEALEKLKINAELMEDIEARLDSVNRNTDSADIYFNMNNLSKEEHTLINDLIFLILNQTESTPPFIFKFLCSFSLRFIREILRKNILKYLLFYGCP